VNHTFSRKLFHAIMGEPGFIRGDLFSRLRRSSVNKKWGTYPWFAENGVDLIHPDDLEDFMEEANNCKVYECIAESEYLTLRYNKRDYRVKDKLFKLVPAPKFSFGQTVKIKTKDEEAIITDIMWHSSNQQHYYLLSIEKKNPKDILSLN